MQSKQSLEPGPSDRSSAAPNETGRSFEPDAAVIPSPELLALFRLLIREPPPDHDFNACPICKRYGITRI